MTTYTPTEADGKRAFSELRPFCVRVMSYPSLESLAELRDKVNHLPVAIHPHLLDYVLLPVRALLKRYGRQVRERKIEPAALVFSHYRFFKYGLRRHTALCSRLNLLSVDIIINKCSQDFRFRCIHFSHRATAPAPIPMCLLQMQPDETSSLDQLYIVVTGIIFSLTAWLGISFVVLQFRCAASRVGFEDAGSCAVTSQICRLLGTG